MEATQASEPSRPTLPHISLSAMGPWCITHSKFMLTQNKEKALRHLASTQQLSCWYHEAGLAFTAIHRNGCDQFELQSSLTLSGMQLSPQNEKTIKKS
jgi:hypothetical protein